MIFFHNKGIQTAGWFITQNRSPVQILSVLGLFVLLRVLPQILVRFQELCTNCFMSAYKGGKKKKCQRSFSSNSSYLCLYNIFKNQCLSGTGLYLQKLMHMQVRSEVNSQLTYQHMHQATHVSLCLKHHKWYHDFTLPCCR